MTRRTSKGQRPVERSGARPAEGILDPTEKVIYRCKQDFAALAEKVDRNFKTLHAATLARPAASHPGPRSPKALPAGSDELRAMLRTAVRHELASEWGRALIGEVVQERFRIAAQQLRAQASPLQKLRAAASHKPF